MAAPDPMKRVAIVGGGIAGLATAYELSRAQGADTALELRLFEASHRAGGIVETERRERFVVECGPDSWVSEKPWARELAEELGLASEIIPSNDRWRRTYIARDRSLLPIPDGMRMMVPTNWAALLDSPLFSWQARLAYLREPRRADELKQSALADGADISVADFVRHHFGDEATRTIAGPLLAGVFGGDIETLSAAAVLPAFVKMEREEGSLVNALRKKMERSSSREASVFTTLRNGLQGLIDGMMAALSAETLRLKEPVRAIARQGSEWQVMTSTAEYACDELVLATPAHVTRALLAPIQPRFDSLLRMEASSAIVVALAYQSDAAKRLRIPRGFGFLVPPAPAGQDASPLLACTFVDQKFSHRVPEDAILLRAFFGGAAAPAHIKAPDEELAELARAALSCFLGPLPQPSWSVVRRWPLSLPQYAVGHLARIRESGEVAASIPGLHLVGNAYHGVGLPDLVRDGRALGRKIAAAMSARSPAL